MIKYNIKKYGGEWNVQYIQRELNSYDLIGLACTITSF